MTLKTVRSSVYGYRDALVYTTLKPFHFGGAEYSSIARIILCIYDTHDTFFSFTKRLLSFSHNKSLT